MTFSSQLIGFTKKNFILKYRNKLQLAADILNPSFMLVSLIIFNYLFNRQQFDEIEFFVREEFPSLLLRNQSINLLITPNNNYTNFIGRSIRSYLKFGRTEYFDDLIDLKSSYAKDRTSTVQTFGLEFSYENFPFDYTIYKQWSEDIFSKENVNLFTDSRECRKNATKILDLYEDCPGYKYVYDGLSSIKYYTDIAIKNVRNFFKF